MSEIIAVASKFGNSAKIITPRSWFGRRVIAFLHCEFMSKHPEKRTKPPLAAEGAANHSS
jgi:hypothetical protein